jgi:hypothetical protein
MKKLLTILFLSLLALPVQATTLVFEPSTKQTGGIVYSFTLLDTPCEDKPILEAMAKEGVPENTPKQAGRFVWEGKDYKSCWVLDMDHFDIMGDDLKFVQPLPLGLFKEANTI